LIVKEFRTNFDAPPDAVFFSPVASYLVYLNTFLGTPFLTTLGPCSCLIWERPNFTPV